MTARRVDPRIGTTWPVGWTQTKNSNYRRQSRGHLIVLFTDEKKVEGKAFPVLAWGYGVDGLWSTDRFEAWWEAEDAALIELKRVIEFERGL
jgi:hypothetical protein